MNHGVSQRSQRIESGTERPNITASSIRTAQLFAAFAAIRPPRIAPECHAGCPEWMSQSILRKSTSPIDWIRATHGDAGSIRAAEDPIDERRVARLGQGELGFDRTHRLVSS